MKSDTSPLVSKLTLLVLTLILGCLVLLVVRAYLPTRTRTTVAENESSAPVEDPNPTVNPLPAPMVKRNPSATPAIRTPTNVVSKCRSASNQTARRTLSATPL